MERDNFNLGISNIILDYWDDSKIKFDKCLDEVKDKVYVCKINTTKPTYNCNLCGKSSRDELLRDSNSERWMRPHHMKHPFRDSCKKCIKKDFESKKQYNDILGLIIVAETIISFGFFTWCVVTGRKLKAR